MNDALYIAATGMHAHQRSVETIANNLANVNTIGFKRGRINFADLIYRPVGVKAASVTDAMGGAPLVNGSGVAVARIVNVFEGGDLKKTDRPMDFAVRGEGFVELSAPDGGAVFMRSGRFGIDKDGYLVAADGLPVKPSIHVGIDVSDVVIETDGRVQARSRPQDALAEVGQLELVRFPDMSGLAAAGNGTYRATATSGEPITGRASENGMGQFAQGFPETSNVDMTEEMVALMTAQRAYESSVKVIQATDEMMSMSNSLRK
jgi:flagellar basal-body rod protein FlgG